MVTAASLGFYLRLTQPLLDAVCLGVSGFPHTQGCGAQALTWDKWLLDWPRSFTGSLWDHLCIRILSQPHQSDGLFLASHTTSELEHFDGVLWSNTCIQRSSHKIRQTPIVYKADSLDCAPAYLILSVAQAWAPFLKPCPSISEHPFSRGVEIRGKVFCLLPDKIRAFHVLLTIDYVINADRNQYGQLFVQKCLW